MNGTIDGFSYGLVTPVAAYVMACVGSALGLRCVVRTVHHEPGWRLGWLALGASALGCGIWTMHFIAMTGFSVAETPVTYDVPLTVLSLAVAIVVVSAGVFIVGHRGATRAALTVGGSITGLGVATMHYLGMFAMQLNGELSYNAFTVTLSVIIALVAATAALWAAVSVQGFIRTLGASLVMGLAVTGMHYTGMAAVNVHLHNGIESSVTGQESTSLLLPMLLGPIIFLILAAAIVMFDPVLILGDGGWDKPASRSAPRSSHAERPCRCRCRASRTLRRRWPTAPRRPTTGRPHRPSGPPRSTPSTAARAPVTPTEPGTRRSSPSCACRWPGRRDQPRARAGPSSSGPDGFDTGRAQPRGGERHPYPGGARTCRARATSVPGKRPEAPGKSDVRTRYARWQAVTRFDHRDDLVAGQALGCLA